MHCVCNGSFLLLQDGWNALHWAAYIGHPVILKLLVSNDADITAVTKVCKAFCMIVSNSQDSWVIC